MLSLNAIAVFKKESQFKHLLTMAVSEEERKKPILSKTKACWDDAKAVFKYKVESELLAKNYCREHINMERYEQYKRIPIVLEDPEEVEVKEDWKIYTEKMVDMGTSFQIDAPAGTGKTTFLKYFIDILEERKITFHTMAPTHKACRLLKDGTTIHHFTNSKDDGYLKTFDNHYIIIDEKSMTKEGFYKMLFKLKRSNDNIKFVISGDWKQIPPVMDRAEFDYKNSIVLSSITDYSLQTFSKCRRSDAIMFNICQNADKVEKKDFGNVEQERSVSYFNSTRKDINRKWMVKYSKSKQHIVIDRNKQNKNSQDIYVYKGLPVMACKTSDSHGFVNSDEGHIHCYDDETVTINIDGLESYVSMSHTDFSKCFYPAYCITIHKAQGASFDFPYTIYDWGKLDTCLKYIALSRTTKKEFVNIF
jgi:ATP-dependent exoDNAse (exonuclease V) alpha subunit